MADLVVTFCRTKRSGADETAVPLGRGVRTTALLITSSSQVTADAAGTGEYVSLLANAACWVQIGAAPTADALASSETAQGTDVWPMAEGERMDRAVQAGDKVAVIQA